MPKVDKAKDLGRRTERGGVKPDRERRPSTSAQHKHRHPRDTGPTKSPLEYAHIVDQDRTTYVLVPVVEYEELIKASMVRDAVAQIENSTDDDYVDADDFALELAAESITRARKAKGMTQKQLAAKLKVPQSQISRIERNPDRTTVRTLKRIAKALGVDVSALI